MKIEIKEQTGQSVRFAYSYTIEGTDTYWRMQNVNELAQYHRRITGGYWFAENTRKSFGSRILDIRHGTEPEKWNFFIESTCGYLANKGKRDYAIHRLAMDGTIEDHGEFSSPSQARKQLARLTE